MCLVLEEVLWHLVFHIAKNRTYRIYSEITDLVTVVTAAYSIPVSRGCLLATGPDGVFWLLWPSELWWLYFILEGL